MNAVNNLLSICADIKAHEEVLVIADPSTTNVADIIAKQASLMAKTHSICIPAMTMHGQEPTESIADLMLEHNVIIGLTKKSLAHTNARQQASKKGNRYLSLPDYSLELLEHEALRFDFRKLITEADKIANLLTKGICCKVTSKLGTNISFDLKGRQANSCPGIASKPGTLASPPDSETNIAPLEYATNGTIVVDGSIPCEELGILKKPITLKVEKGFITSIFGAKSDILDNLFAKTGNPKSKILGEVGIGLNPKASICGIMLIDEGCRGTVHFGFGSNCTIGGVNDAPIHLDMIIKDPTVEIDDYTLIKDGRIKAIA